MPNQRPWMQGETPFIGLVVALLLIWFAGMFGRGYWTPDEPREADIAWRMSWQADKAVPQLAGEAFCEKPPLAYWIAAVPIAVFGPSASAARLPNLLYALITALCLGLLGMRGAGLFAGWVAAATVSTFLLAYQVAIWLATDAPLLAAVAASLLGAYTGFYAADERERLRGYLLMHGALALGFLSKSAVAWMVPSLAIVSLSLWERRWRELFRWELWAGLAVQAVAIFTWVYFVYVGTDGLEHLKVFFWNNLVGRFTAVDAPAQIQYTTGHKNSPGKYLIELPMYLFPWTLAVLAAAHCAWRQRRDLMSVQGRLVRFAIASSLPSLLILSLAATARNIYFAPALPGFALLLAWWAMQIVRDPDAWDVRALKATAAMVMIGVIAFLAALGLMASDSGSHLQYGVWALISALGILAAAGFAILAWRNARTAAGYALGLVFLAYCALLAGPASQIYRTVDNWQDLGRISQAIHRDTAGGPLVLLSPDETTLAVIDLYAPDGSIPVSKPIVATDARSARILAGVQGSILVQLPKRPPTFLQRFGKLAPVPDLPEWIAGSNLRIWREYAVPNGRRYALLKGAS